MIFKVRSNFLTFYESFYTHLQIFLKVNIHLGFLSYFRSRNSSNAFFNIQGIFSASLEVAEKGDFSYGVNTNTER